MRAFFVKTWDAIITNPTHAAAVVTGIMPMLVVLHVWWLSAGQVAAIGAVVAGVVYLAAAFATKHPTLAVVVGAFQAAVALAAAYGWNLSADSVATIVGVLGVLAGLFHWSQSSPQYGALAQRRRNATGPKAVFVANSADFAPAMTRATIANPDDLAAAIASKNHSVTVTNVADFTPAPAPVKKTTARRATKKTVKPEPGSDAAS